MIVIGQAQIAGERRAVLQQALTWDELSAQQRMVIVNAVVPSCFPAESRRLLAGKAWAEINPRTQLALSTVQWEQIISGGVQ